MDNLRSLLVARKMDKGSKTQIKELLGTTKGMDDKTDIRVFGHVERMENDMIAKRVCVCGGMCE